jgi:hypothetical protein
VSEVVGQGDGNLGLDGGARRDRTADLVIANDALSQLSYGPKNPVPSEDAEYGQAAVQCQAKPLDCRAARRAVD